MRAAGGCSTSARSSSLQQQRGAVEARLGVLLGGLGPHLGAARGPAPTPGCGDSLGEEQRRAVTACVTPRNRRPTAWQRRERPRA